MNKDKEHLTEQEETKPPQEPEPEQEQEHKPDNEQDQTQEQKQETETEQRLQSPTNGSHHQSPTPSDSPPHSISSDQSSPSPLSSSSPEHHRPPVAVVEPSPPTVAATRQEGYANGSAKTDVEEPKPGVSGNKRVRPNMSVLKRDKRSKMMNMALFGFRVCGFLFCLVSFSVMAADKDQGWAIDSFYKYKEFRYCMAVNVIGFVYSGFQMSDLAYRLAMGKKSRHYLRHYFDFAIDQVLSCLLISSSSSAAVRVDDWQLNWGADKFPEMARASVSVSFLAFAALALSSLVSGYTLCHVKSI